MVKKIISVKFMIFLISTLASAEKKELECKPGKYGLVY